MAKLIDEYYVVQSYTGSYWIEDDEQYQTFREAQQVAEQESRLTGVKTRIIRHRVEVVLEGS